MWHSIEILVPDPRDDADLDFSTCALTVVTSDPPKSHRGPQAHWQPRFDALGGRLFHIGDPFDIKVRNDRYYVYDAFAPLEVASNFRRFSQVYQPDFETVLSKLCAASAAGAIHVTDDVWLGPKPKAYKRPIALPRFIEETRRRGLRSNSWRDVVLSL
ncbi:MAG: hypothetical protein JSR86_19010 [Proteobacteria bacterium]|nr:hypothetical protein [Pseudomonadota bacterium]